MPAASRHICIGFDTPNADAFAVFRHSLRRHMIDPIPVLGIELADMRRRGYYRRPTTRRIPDGQLWDDISEAPMSTEFAISRFLTPFVAGWGKGWALFADCDMLAFGDVGQLFDILDPAYALMCVQPAYQHTSDTKMDGRAQTQYPRKLWSSLMAFNMEHPANRALTLELINTVPGRDLHRFCWLNDRDIGELPAGWNWMQGITAPDVTPEIVHYTAGGPWLPEYRDCAFADQWDRERTLWVRGDQ